MRKLTKKEIRDILGSLKVQKGLPKKIQQKIYHNIVMPLIKPLSEIRIKPNKIPDLKKEILRQYYNAIIQPGENVGVIAAQSISEKNTQTTLDTFHTLNTGMQTVLTGIPRFKELCDATSNPKVHSVKIILKNENDNINLTCVYLKDLITTYDIWDETPVCPYLDDFLMIYNKDIKYNKCIRFFIDLKVQYRHRITFEIIQNALEDFDIVYGPLGTDYFDLVYENDVDVEDIEKLMEIALVGIPGITNIYIKDSKTILTEGIKPSQKILRKIFAEILAHPNIDSEKTVSNHLWDIYNVLGIEASRQFLIDEFKSITSEGGFINPKHIECLVSFMVHSGEILPNTRQTMKHNESSVISKISFEEPIDNLVIAAFHNSVDNIDEACANIFCGKAIKTGSGMPDILMDMDKIINF